MADLLFPTHWLEDGEHAAAHHHVDQYPSDGEPPDRVLARIVDRLLRRLDDRRRRAIELVVFAGMSYRQAAVELGDDRDVEGDWTTGDPERPDKKKVWREVRYGIAELREELLGTPWMGALAHHRLPDDEFDTHTGG